MVYGLLKLALLPVETMTASSVAESGTFEPDQFAAVAQVVFVPAQVLTVPPQAACES
ncbi:MAG TPA: hypothetical protein VNJ08_17780 [Bacteriovoracaceae bacterium]|nr:hypothetical protein [Bacteriovoracaceae bacterium]